MSDNNNDLLDIEEHNQRPEQHYFQASREETSNLVYGWMMLGFLILLGIKFVQSLTDTSTSENAIIARQVQLLEVIQNSKNEQEVEQAVQEYDSLGKVLENLEAN